ncbi:Hypothetical protein SMAX5B_008165 [Scophthalmus maximus]|uniref:Uncharacterized protein n=1 Tax=Scophthalmus maximus TaxID=52904 RepID=A0A2U9CT84_SCOMX|nr:Hypothetical protein SMAX5B_008165 [Scophthalmus maximus]
MNSSSSNELLQGVSWTPGPSCYLSFTTCTHSKLSHRQDDRAERFTPGKEITIGLNAAACMGEPLGFHHLLHFAHSVTP